MGMLRCCYSDRELYKEDCPSRLKKQMRRTRQRRQARETTAATASIYSNGVSLQPPGPYSKHYKRLTYISHKHARGHTKNTTDIITTTTASAEPTEFTAVLNMRTLKETTSAINASLTKAPITIRRSQTWTSTVGVPLETEAPDVDEGFDLLDRKRFNSLDDLLSEATATASTSEEWTIFATPSETFTLDLPLETDDLPLSTEDVLSLLSATATSNDFPLETDDSLVEKRQLLGEVLPTDDSVLSSTSLSTEVPSSTTDLVLPTKAPNATEPAPAVECTACIDYCTDEDDPLPDFPCLKECLTVCETEEEPSETETEPADTEAELAETEQKRRAIPGLPIPSVRRTILPVPSVTTSGIELPTAISGLPLPSASALSGCQSCVLKCAGKNVDLPSLLLCIEGCVPVCKTATEASVTVLPTPTIPATPLN